MHEYPDLVKAVKNRFAELSEAINTTIENINLKEIDVFFSLNRDNNKRKGRYTVI